MATTRGTSWSVTINNPTKEDDEDIARARQKGWKVIGQLEKGEEGTPHYQLSVRTPQVRWSAVKKTFRRGHSELARNAAALDNYATKEATRVGILPESQEQYPSLKRYWELVFDYLYENDCDPGTEQGYSEKTALARLDEATDHLIRQGYYVETIAVNPQTRSAFAKFSSSLSVRYKHSQTERQTDGAVEQAVEIPTVVT